MNAGQSTGIEAPMRTPWIEIVFAACFGILAACAGCGSSGGPQSFDAAVVADTAAPIDAAAPPSDGPSEDLAAIPDGAAPDLAWDPAQPHPPTGAKVCGQGTFTAADSNKVCRMPSSTLDHWGMQGQPFPRACDGATFSGGAYEVWCSANFAYVFFTFAGLRATGTLRCKGATALYLDAVYESGNGGGDTGNNTMNGYAGSPDNFFDTAMPIDAHAWLTVAVAAKSATLWLAPFSALLARCGSMNSGDRSLVAGATAIWKL